MKMYLWENCDYTFDTLKENMLKAMESVKLEVIRHWEHCMFRWMEAYRLGLGTADTQAHVKEFSSTKYKSHRYIPQLHAHLIRCVRPGRRHQICGWFGLYLTQFFSKKKFL
jgi:hypothetical protein